MFLFTDYLKFFVTNIFFQDQERRSTPQKTKLIVSFLLVPSIKVNKLLFCFYFTRLIRSPLKTISSTKDNQFKIYHMPTGAVNAWLTSKD